MRVRPAKFADIPDLWRIMLGAYERSRFVDVTTPNEQVFKNICQAAVREHMKGTGQCLFVAPTDQRLEGFILGLLERVYHIGNHLQATDLWWVVREDAAPWAAEALFDSFALWAEGFERVVEFRQGAVDAVTPWRRTAKFYERKGFTQEGGLYRKERTR